MIENLIPRSILNIALILTTVIVGIVLHKAGRPYNNAAFAIHKLTTVIFVVMIIRMIIPYTNMHVMNPLSIGIIVLASISVSGLIISGGAMSLDKCHELMLTIHRLSTLAFLFTMLGLFFMLFQKIK